MTTTQLAHEGPQSSTISLEQLPADFNARKNFAAAQSRLRQMASGVDHLWNCGLPSLLRAARRDARAILDDPSVGVRRLLTPPQANPKLAQSHESIWSLSLAPADQSGSWHVCPGSTPACEAGCLGWHSGHSAMGEDNPTRRARIRRTRALLTLSESIQWAALVQLRGELEQAARRGPCAVRLNAFSDLAWEWIWPQLFEAKSLSNIRWYDYTKIPGRSTPKNYSLTLSWTPKLDKIAGYWLRTGRNIAVIFGVKNSSELPQQWRGWPVLDGTQSDARWRDPRGWIVGLTWKGSPSRQKWQQSCDGAKAAGWVVSPTDNDQPTL